MGISLVIINLSSTLQVRTFMRKYALIVAVLLLAISAPVLSQDAVVPAAPPNPSAVTLTQVASGFTRPILVTNASDGSGRLFVVEQTGKIWIVENSVTLETPFLDVSTLISQDALNLQGYSERGLLGLAFHPNYQENGQFYIHYNDLNGDTVIARYFVSASDPNLADPTSAMTILTQDQPYPNHNGGQMAFGQDGYLYISLGDGGSRGDPENRAQNLSTLLGKILRIDVDHGEPYAVPEENPFVGQDGAAPEIWAYGLRNVWRFSFDTLTGDLYTADVGQNQFEEVNFQPADSTGGENYGWRVYEAMQQYSRGEAVNAVMPVAYYGHSQGISVTGGYVYRGEQIPQLQGIYLFGDWGSGTIWWLYRDETGAWQYDVFIANTGYNISSFGEDEQNELYLVDYSGTIYRFDPA
jgi:glucose/arabinose dehydrogenase